MKCAVGPCREPREGGAAYCRKHGPYDEPRASGPSLPGQARLEMICPHCQERGSVRTEQVKVKRGISGGKATGAVLTAGVSMLATGLSRKEKVTRATCGNCGAAWTF